MTQVARIFEEEKQQALTKVARIFEEKQQALTQAEKKYELERQQESRQLVLKMLKKRYNSSEIASLVSEYSVEKIEMLRKEMNE